MDCISPPPWGGVGGGGSASGVIASAEPPSQPFPTGEGPFGVSLGKTSWRLLLNLCREMEKGTMRSG